MELLQSPSPFLQESRSRRGQLHPPLRSIEQTHPQLAFEFLDLAREPGLREVQPLGRAAEV
jgi:hypothetical protein